MAATSATANTTSQQSTSPLFRLPAELRNRIYELVLKETPHFFVRCACCVPSDHNATQSPLTSTCRAIRSETLGIFYGNDFCLVRKLHAEAWLLAIGSANRKLLGHVFMPGSISTWQVRPWGPDRIRSLRACGEKTMRGVRFVRLSLSGFEEQGGI